MSPFMSYSQMSHSPMSCSLMHAFCSPISCLCSPVFCPNTSKNWPRVLLTCPVPSPSQCLQRRVLTDLVRSCGHASSSSTNLSLANKSWDYRSLGPCMNFWHIIQDWDVGIIAWISLQRHICIALVSVKKNIDDRVVCAWNVFCQS